MKNKRIISAALAASLMIQVLAPSTAYASKQIEKDETIFVNMNSKGEIEKQTASVWLHGDENLDYSERTKLTDIKNIKTKEEYDLDGNRLTWKLDNNQVYYQGNLDEDLPVEVDVEYILDGKSMDKSDLENVSGDLEVKINLENKEYINKKINGKEERVYKAHGVLTTVIFESEDIKTMKSNTGKIINDSKNAIFTSLSLPGMKEMFEPRLSDLDLDLNDLLEDEISLELEVENFTMPSIMITIADENLESEKIREAKDIDELLDGIDELKENSDKILEGIIKLNDGSDKLSSGFSQFEDGVNKLSKGSDELYNGVLKLKDNYGALESGSSQLSSGSKTLVQGSSEFTQGLGKYQGKMGEYSNKNKEFTQGLNTYTSAIANLDKEVQSAKDNYFKEINEVSSGISQLEKGTAGLSQGSESLLNGLKLLDRGINDDQALPALKLGGEEAAKSSKDLSEGLNQLSQANGKLNQGLSKVDGGLSQLNSKFEELNNSMNSDNQRRNSLNKINELPTLKTEYSFENQEAKNKNSSIKDRVEALSRRDDLTDDVKKELENILGDLNTLDSSLSGSIKINEIETINNEIAGIKKELNNSPVPSGNPYENLLKAYKEIEGQMNTIVTSSEEVNSGLNSVSKGSSQLSQGLSSLNQGIKKLDTSLSTALSGDLESPGLITGMESLNSGIKEVEEGQKTLFGKGKSSLVSGYEKAKTASSELNKNGQKLNKGANQLNDAGKALNDASSQLYISSKELNKGANSLRTGINNLDIGISRIAKEGINPLASGSKALAGGVNELNSNTGKISKGINDLHQGTNSLEENYEKFNEEGINKLNKEVKEKSDAIKEIIELKDEVIELSKDVESITGISEIDDLSIKQKYIIKID